MAEATFKRIDFTKSAMNDLLKILEFLEGFSFEIADKAVERIIARTDLLLSFPLMGQKEPLMKHHKIDYRYLIEGKYKIIYSLGEEIIYIHRIFDTRQNPKKLKP